MSAAAASSASPPSGRGANPRLEMGEKSRRLRGVAAAVLLAEPGVFGAKVFDSLLERADKFGLTVALSTAAIVQCCDYQGHQFSVSAFLILAAAFFVLAAFFLPTLFVLAAAFFILAAFFLPAFFLLSPGSKIKITGYHLRRSQDGEHYGDICSGLKVFKNCPLSHIHYCTPVGALAHGGAKQMRFGQRACSACIMFTLTPAAAAG